MTARPRMHADEVETSPELLSSLLRDQFPHWAQLSITLVDSYGTDHDIYRLGPDLSVRMPRIGWAMQQADLEAAWLPRLAPRLPLAVPEPVATGEPGHDYPFRWAVHRWLPGTDANDSIEDLDRAALDLAEFVHALQMVDTAGAPHRPRGAKGGPLRHLDDAVRERVQELPATYDEAAVLRTWDAAIQADAWDGPPVWVHCDLLPGNLLVEHGRLSAVIDWGSLAVGDPAADLIPAWNTFRGPSGRTYLDALGADEATIERARGWVVAGAVFAIPYYLESNPAIVGQSALALEAALAEY